MTMAMRMARVGPCVAKPLAHMRILAGGPSLAPRHFSRAVVNAQGRSSSIAAASATASAPAVAAPVSTPLEHSIVTHGNFLNCSTGQTLIFSSVSISCGSLVFYFVIDYLMLYPNVCVLLLPMFYLSSEVTEFKDFFLTQELKAHQWVFGIVLLIRDPSDRVFAKSFLIFC